MPWTSGLLSSLSTSSVLRATAIVFTWTVALADAFPTEVAVTLAMFVVEVPLSMWTRTHTPVESPGATLGVVVIELPHNESRQLTVKPASDPDDDMLYESVA